MVEGEVEMVIRFEVDESVETAWNAFAYRLAATLVELPIAEWWRVALPVGVAGGRPRIAEVRRRRRSLIAAVSPNGIPLAGYGAEPGSATTKVVRRGREQELASWLVERLRGDEGVIHPAFLEPRTGFAPTLVPSQSEIARQSGVVPHTPDELDDLVEQALAARYGDQLDRDDDGDLRVESERGWIYIRVRRDRPIVEVFTIVALVDNPADAALAREVANERNAGSGMITYVATGPVVVARVPVWARPFHADALRAAVSEVRRAVGRGPSSVSSASAVAAEGAPSSDDSAAQAPLPEQASDVRADLAQELLTILQLEAAEEGSVTPKLAARIFGFDCGRVLECIREAELQEIAWRRSASEARAAGGTDADVCLAETSSWTATVALLRAALRVVVES